MSDNSWVKVYRSMIESDIGDDLLLLGLWCKILVEAKWKPRKIKIGLKQVQLQSGDAYYVVTELSDCIKIKRTKLKNLLKYLEETERIKITKQTRGIVVSVCNWEIYQGNANTTNMRNTHDEQCANTTRTRTNIARTRREHELPNTSMISNNLQAPKKERREEGKKERNHPPVPPTFSDRFTPEFFDEMRAQDFMLSEKDLLWAVDREIDGRVLFISCLHFLHDLKVGALDHLKIKSNVGWFKHSMAETGNYYSEGYERKQKRRKDKELEYVREFDHDIPCEVDTEPIGGGLD